MSKRIILITLIISLFSIFTVFAENNREPVSYEGKNVVEYLKIINSEVDLDSDFVTRELFALYVARMLNIDEMKTSNVRYFSDVEYDSFSASAINALVERGIISVPENHLFRPGDYITQTEALKMLVCVLGYEQYAVVNSGYPGGYINTAAKLDIYVNCKNENIMTVAEAGEMIYNALRTNLFGACLSDGKTYSESEETFLQRYWDICEAEGTVEAVYGASTIKSFTADDNTVFINGEEYRTGEINTGAYIGSYVHYFYKEETQKDNAEIIVMENAGRLDDIKINAEKFESFSGETIFYYNDSNKVVKKILNNPVIIYNGSVLGENLSETMKNINKGSIVLKDSDDDNEYDVIVIEDYRGFVISSVSDEGRTVYDKSGLMENLKFDEYETVILKNSLGEKISYADLKIGQVLSVAKSKNKEYIKVIVELNKVNGTLAGINKNEFGTEITIDDERFILDKTFVSYFEKLGVMGSKYEFTVDSFDRIVYLTLSEETSEYGYVLKVYSDDDNEKTVIKMLTHNNEIQIFECRDKIMLDGSRYDEQGVLSVMKAGSDDCHQVIRYTLNNGMISKIDTKELGYESEKTSMYNIFKGQERQSRWYSNSKMGLKALINSDTTIFCVPDNFEGAFDDDFFTVKINEFTADSFHVCDAYKDGSINSYADAMVIYYDSISGWANNTTARTKLFVVEEITQQLYNDDVVTAIHGYEGGVETVVYDDEGMDFSKIEKGDMLRFGYDRDGTLRRINDNFGYEFIYDCSTKDAPSSEYGHWFNTATLIDASADPATGCLVYNKGGLDTGYYRSNYQISYGEVLSLKDGVAEWNGTGGNVYTDTADLSVIPIVVVDEELDEVTKGNADNIIDRESSPYNCSRIFYEQRGGVGVSAVIYNFK